MSITAGRNGRVIVDFFANGASGKPAAKAYWVGFSIKYHMPAWQFLQSKTHGDPQEKYDHLPVWFTLSHAKINLTNNQMIGFAYPELTRTFKPQDSEASGYFLLEILLSYEQMEYIESTRGGGDISFDVNLVGEYDDGLNHLGAVDTVVFRINQKSWIDILNSTGYGKRIIYEADIPLNLGNEFKSVIDVFEQAQKQLYYGEYDVVVGKCREAIESFVQLTNLNNQFGDAKGLYRGSREERESMTKDQRLFLLIESIRHFTHGAHHPDNGTQTSYSRSDALCILGATAGVLSSFTTKLASLRSANDLS